VAGSSSSRRQNNSRSNARRPSPSMKLDDGSTPLGTQSPVEVVPGPYRPIAQHCYGRRLSM
jgi:hypothetical protein